MKPTMYVFAATLLAGGCADTGNRARQTPDDAPAGKISVTVGNFVDTDQNRYLDTSTATVYVWAASAAYPIPMRARGTFSFQLQTQNGKELASWQFDERQTAAAMRALAPGPGFVFELSLAGHDRLEQSEAELVCTYTPVLGPPLHARPGALLAVGATRRPRPGG